MRCRNCGTKLQHGAKCCNKCGMPINITTQLVNKVPKANCVSANDMTKQKGIGNPKIYKSFKFGYGESTVVFLLNSPFGIEQTTDLISCVFKKAGSLKKVALERGYIKGQINESHLGKVNFETYITPTEAYYNECRVSVIMQSVWHNQIKPKIADKLYDVFLKELFMLEPNADFGVSLANKRNVQRVPRLCY